MFDHLPASALKLAETVAEMERVLPHRWRDRDGTEFALRCLRWRQSALLMEMYNRAARGKEDQWAG
jgi:hypothetical protein